MPLKKQTNNEDFSDSAPYRDQDAQQFEALNEQIKYRQSHTSRSERKKKKPVHHHFSYSESDVAQFQTILPDVNSADRQETLMSDEKTNSGFTGAYKQSDNDQFQALMNFNDNQSRGHDAKPAFTNNDDRSFSYSELDLQTFSQLEHPGLANKANTSDIFSQTPSRPERDVGPIKIMQFDGKSNKARKTSRQSNRNIKVRYFD